MRLADFRWQTVRRLDLLIWLLVCHALSAVAQVNLPKQCFFPSGAVSSGRPCNSDNSTSTCCGTGFSCLSNGLCEASSLEASTSRFKYYRPSCTDSKWNDPACSKLCNGSDDNKGYGQGLQLCDANAGVYCCGRDVDCCSNSTLIVNLGKGDVVRQIPAIHDPSLRVNTTANQTANPALHPTETSQHAGLGVGLGLGFLGLLIITALWLWYLRQRRKSRRESGAGDIKDLDGGDSATAGKAPSSATTSIVFEPVELSDLSPRGRSSPPPRQPTTSPPSVLSTTDLHADLYGLEAPPIPARNPARSLRSNSSSRASSSIRPSTTDRAASQAPSSLMQVCLAERVTMARPTLQHPMGFDEAHANDNLTDEPSHTGAELAPAAFAFRPTPARTVSESTITVSGLRTHLRRQKSSVGTISTSGYATPMERRASRASLEDQDPFDVQELYGGSDEDFEPPHTSVWTEHQNDSRVSIPPIMTMILPRKPVNAGNGQGASPGG